MKYTDFSEVVKIGNFLRKLFDIFHIIENI